MRPFIFALILGMSAFYLSGLAAAATGGNNEIILTVSGRIGNQEDSKQEFDLESLKKIGPVTITTSSPWINGKARFKGVLLREVMDLVRAPEGAQVLARAMDNYTTEIPWEDIANYDVLLAFEVNGVALTRRDKGPLWVIYPVDDHPELATVEVNYRWIWQLISLEIR